MEYLQRIESIEKAISRSRQLVIGLMLLLGLFIVFIPQALKNANPVLIQTPEGAEIATASPWKLSETRIARFTDAYLSARFQWNQKSFEDKKRQLSRLTDPTVFARLKDSVQAFSGLAQNQDARGYYVLEAPPTWDGKKTIEAHVTRVLRIQSAALATPLVIRLSYTETAVTPENVYGLEITAIDESQPGDAR